jgi:hypothetical protein
MMLGGILAASDRRYRRNAPQAEFDTSAAKPAEPDSEVVTENRE